MQGKKLPCAKGFEFWMIDVSRPTVGARLVIVVFNCGLPETILIRLLPRWEVHCGIHNIPRTMSRLSICSPNVFSVGADASSSVWGLTTAGTLNSGVPYFLSPSRRESAASSHPSCIILSSFICFYRNVSMRCCPILVIVPITQPGLSSSLSWPCSVSSSSSSSTSSPWLEHARSLRQSPIATIICWNVI